MITMEQVQQELLIVLGQIKGAELAIESFEQRRLKLMGMIELLQQEAATNDIREQNSTETEGD